MEKNISMMKMVFALTLEKHTKDLEREYTNVDYNNLIESINKSKLFNINYRGNLPDNSINLIKQVIQSNSVFKEDEYLNKWVSSLDTALIGQNIELVEAAWKDLQNTA